MNLKQSFSFLFLGASGTYRNLLERLMDEIGLHAGQVLVLAELWEKDGQSQAELAKRLAVSAPTVTKMITSLAYSDFVETRKGTDDARLTRVFLTKKGKVIRPLVIAQWEKLERIALANLDDGDNSHLATALEKIRTNLSGSN